MMAELLACPFCGEAPHDIPMDSQGCSFYVHCPHCGMCGPDRLNQSGALLAWNARARFPQSPPWISLTDEDRDRAFQTLPDMLDGFLKKWGWLHFAKAVEDICREKNTLATQPQAPQEELGGWIRWFGGECPVAKNLPTEVRLRGEGVSSEIRSAGHWFWSHDLGDMDIVAYRTAPTPETPKGQL